MGEDEKKMELLSVRIDADLKDDLYEKARLRRRRVPDVVRELIAEYVTKPESEDGA